MATVGMQQATYSSQDIPPSFIPHQPQNLQAVPVPPANDAQREDHLNIDIAQPVGDVSGRHGSNHINVTNRGVVGYHPLPPYDPALQYMFPDVGNDQGINPQAQLNLNPPQNQGHDSFGYAQTPRRVAHSPDPTAFQDRFVHQMLVSSQPLAATENLRQLASRYLDHPDSRVDLFYMEPGAAGDCDVVIRLKMPNVLAVITPENRF